MLTLRDPIHGFVRADALEEALINCRPLQRLRYIHQLGFTFLVFPGAEHTRFSHVLGAMELAGKVYDALAAKAPDVLDPDPRCLDRRRVRVAALVHDTGHAPFSHSAEDLFEDGIHHEQMTCRLLHIDEVEALFERHGAGVTPDAVESLLQRPSDGRERLLSQIVSGELDVDKMDYLLRDSLFCGVRYGSYDLPRLLDTMLPIADPQTGEWGIGVDEGGVHALEALVMARYYMFTQVYFNVTGKALELHLNHWLRERDLHWPADPEQFLQHDDVSILAAMRADDSVHARAVVEREHFPLAFETGEHLSTAEKALFRAHVPELESRYGRENLLISNSSKDPHRLGESGVLVRRFDGSLVAMESASHFIRHLGRIERFRIYTPAAIREQVERDIQAIWR